MSYEEFGRRFFELAVTEPRVGAAFASIAGESFDVGPLPTGPGGVVKVLARVKIDEPGITRSVEDLIRFTVQIPLRINIEIDLKLDRLRYDVDGLITLPLTVHAVEPLQIHFDLKARFDLPEAVMSDNTIVFHEQFWTPAVKMADFVLPATTSLERDDIGYGTREPYVIAMKKAREPLGEARDDYQIFNALAERLGVAAAHSGLHQHVALDARGDHGDDRGALGPGLPLRDQRRGRGAAPLSRGLSPLPARALRAGPGRGLEPRRERRSPWLSSPPTPGTSSTPSGLTSRPACTATTASPTSW